MFEKIILIILFKYYKKPIVTLFHSIIFFVKNCSDICDTKTVLVSLSLILLVAASYCIYQTHTENKVWHLSKTKSRGRCQNEYQKYSLNGGESFELIDEDIVGCNR